MKQILFWVLIVSFTVVLQTTISADNDVRQALLDFFSQLSNNNHASDLSFGWTSASDPCQWEGITCDNRTFSVKQIFLSSLEFDGTFNPSTLCNNPSLAASLTFSSLDNNSLHGDLNELANCRQLTHFHANQNQFLGTLPDSLPRLNNHKRLDISDNKFSGVLPDLARISGLIEFIAQSNQLSGHIPDFDFTNLQVFNVSNNNFSGPIPNGGDSFNASSYTGNPQLCRQPLPTHCSSTPSMALDTDQTNTKKSESGLSRDEILMHEGYILIGLALIVLVMLKVCKKGKKKVEMDGSVDYKVATMDGSTYTKPSYISSEDKIVIDKSEVSAASVEESTAVSQSLIVLTSPEVNGLKFEELLKAPAELLGRGKHGSQI